MKQQLLTSLGFLVALSLPSAATAQTANLLTATKIACVPDKITRCTLDNKCETKQATAKDKSEVLVIDFTTKKASVRKNGKLEPFGDVAVDEVSGEERRLQIRETGAKDLSKSPKITLSRAGKMTLFIGGDSHRAEAVCTAES